MGNCVSIIKRKKEPSKPVTLAIIGLDDAGKTTICSILAGEQVDPDIAPTVGFSRVEFSRGNFDVTIFDVGGGKNIRPIWKNYYGEIFAIIYVIDSSSPDRLSEARDVFRESLEHPQLTGKPVLLLANKVDKENHMTESDIIHGLRLEETVNSNNCPSKLVLVSALQGTGSKMDKGISDGLDWLMEKIRELLSSLEPRVEEDMRRAKEARDKEREERKARVKKQREEREKAEELERTRLGLEKKPDSDDDEIVGGNPFKALDINELKKKEQRLKAEKKEKQQRLKDLGYGDSLRKSTESDSERYLGRRSLKNHLSDDDGPNGIRMDDIETKSSAMAMFGRNNRASMLPPLEPLGSATLEGSEKKRQKKKKRLTDYHLHDNSDETELARTRDRLDLAIPRNMRGDPDVHDLTPRNAKGRGPMGLIQAGQLNGEDEREAGLFQRGTAASHRIHLVGGIDDDSDEGARESVMRTSHDKVTTKASQRDLDSHMSREMYGGKKMAGLEKYPRDTHGDALMYRNSLTKISPPNLRPFEEEDEGIEQDDSDNNNRNENISDDDEAELERFRASRRAHKLGSARVRREALGLGVQERQKDKEIMQDRYNSSRGMKGNSKGYSGHRNQMDSDQDRDDDGEIEYGTYNPLKDTLRFSYDETRDLTKEMEKLRMRHENSEYRGMNGYGGQDNKGYDASPTKPRSRLRGNSEDYDDEEYGNNRGSRAINSHNLQSPDEYADYNEKSTDQRKKKKRNLLRSNKLTPSENDNAHRFGSPRVVQEHGSRNTSDAETPTKNRNSRITQFHRNDSDFNAKWGLAEDLPAIDDSFRRRRMPNFDDSDEGDVVF